MNYETIFPGARAEESFGPW